MRLEEFITENEWERLARIIYDCTWHALTTYQQQHPANGHKPVQQLAVNPTAKLKVTSAKAQARKTKRPPHAAAIKPLPKPVQQPQAKPAASQAYRPVKTTTPLPPTTRKALATAHPRTPQSLQSKPVQQVMPQPTDMDQAGRRMLPANRRGQNPIDMLAPMHERG
jgi:hypothetical protein